MQKSAYCTGPTSGRRWYNAKTLLAMKLTCILLTAAFLNVSAKGLSQHVSFTGANVPLEKIFREVKKQTGYVFFYRENVLHNTKPVTVSARNMPLDQFLATVLKGQSLKYVIKSKSISISKIPPAILPPISEKAMKGTSQFPPVTITGRVVDADGKGIVGVTIQVKGHETSTVSDAAGYYRIPAPD